MKKFFIERQEAAAALVKDKTEPELRAMLADLERRSSERGATVQLDAEINACKKRLEHG